jgi:hypothetical protein
MLKRGVKKEWTRGSPWDSPHPKAAPRRLGDSYSLLYRELRNKTRESLAQSSTKTVPRTRRVTNSILCT